jgi:hypothetical protein
VPIEYICKVSQFLKETDVSGKKRVLVGARRRLDGNASSHVYTCTKHIHTDTIIYFQSLRHYPSSGVVMFYNLSIFISNILLCLVYFLIYLKMLPQLLELYSIKRKDDCELIIGRGWNKMAAAYFRFYSNTIVEKLCEITTDISP